MRRIDFLLLVWIVDEHEEKLRLEMATPLPDFEAARGVASSSTTVLTSSVPSSSSSRSPVANSFAGHSEDAEEISPILIFLFFHKAVCSELEALHRLALEFATGHHVDLRLLRERYRFLRSIYKHHCNAEDEVIGKAATLLYNFLVHFMEISKPQLIPVSLEICLDFELAV